MQVEKVKAEVARKQRIRSEQRMQAAAEHAYQSMEREDIVMLPRLRTGLQTRDRPRDPRPARMTGRERTPDWLDSVRQVRHLDMSELEDNEEPDYEPPLRQRPVLRGVAEAREVDPNSADGEGGAGEVDEAAGRRSLLKRARTSVAASIAVRKKMEAREMRELSERFNTRLDGEATGHRPVARVATLGLCRASSCKHAHARSHADAWPVQSYPWQLSSSRRPWPSAARWCAARSSCSRL